MLRLMLSMKSMFSVSETGMLRLMLSMKSMFSVSETDDVAVDDVDKF